MNYTDKINLPYSVSTWPSLRNAGAGVPSDDCIFYAEHYNKIKNLIDYVEGSWVNNGESAYSDGSLQGLCYSYSLGIDCEKLFAEVAYDAWSSNSISQPGNVLPFEFVLTVSSDSYANWLANGSNPQYPRMLIQYAGNNSMLNTIVGGLNIFGIFPQITATLESKTTVATTFESNNYLVNVNGLIGTDTICIRGSIIDIGITSMQSDSEKWKSYGAPINLMVNIVGVKY